MPGLFGTHLISNQRRVFNTIVPNTHGVCYFNPFIVSKIIACQNRIRRGTVFLPTTFTFESAFTIFNSFCRATNRAFDLNAGHIGYHCLNFTIKSETGVFSFAVFSFCLLSKFFYKFINGSHMVCTKMKAKRNKIYQYYTIF